MLTRLTAASLILLAILAAVPAHGAGPYPEATDWGPTGTDVPLDPEIVIHWTIRMDTPSVQAAFGLTDGVTSWGEASFSFAHAPNPPFWTSATPTFPLRSLTTYRVTVAPTALDATRAYALDQDGDGRGGEPEDALSFSFTTEDADPPKVLWTNPPDGATNVSIRAVVEVAFSEAMRPDTSGAFSIEPPAAGTFRWSGGASRLTFEPTLDIAYGTTYGVRIRASGATDLSGNPLDGDGDGVAGDDHAFSFTTEPDTGPPRVLAVTPAAGSTGVSVTANVAVAFSETMDRASVEDGFSYWDGTAMRNGTAGRFVWRGVSAADDTVVFNPHANLPFARAILVTVNASRARDAAGFTLDGDGDGTAEGSPADDAAWTFTTEAADTTPPTVLVVDPAPGSMAVSPSTAVRLTFGEAMNRTSVEGAFQLRDGVRTYGKGNGTFAWTTGDEEVTFTPGTNLAYKRMHTVLVAATARDVNGNALDGNGDGTGGDPFASTFETAAQADTVPPHVVGTVPKDGATGVDRVPLVSITFDDAMDRVATEAAISLVRVDGEPPEETPVPVHGFEWSAADHTVSFRPEAPLAWDAVHTVTVSQAARDDADLALERPFTFSFRVVVWRGSVLGRVADASGPVAGATVTLGERTTQTSATGGFELPNVAAGRYSLTVAKPGYETARVVVDVDPLDADPERGGIDLGTISLLRADSVSPVVLLGILGGIVAGSLLIGLWLRRRRIPPWERFEDLDADFGGGQR